MYHGTSCEIKSVRAQTKSVEMRAKTVRPVRIIEFFNVFFLFPNI